eukprot:SAG11_NODE_564_length_8506_cov_4.107529_1_plen_317_part_00
MDDFRKLRDGLLGPVANLLGPVAVGVTLGWTFYALYDAASKPGGRTEAAEEEAEKPLISGGWHVPDARKQVPRQQLLVSRLARVEHLCDDARRVLRSHAQLMVSYTTATASEEEVRRFFLADVVMSDGGSPKLRLRGPSDDEEKAELVGGYTRCEQHELHLLSLADVEENVKRAFGQLVEIGYSPVRNDCVTFVNEVLRLLKNQEEEEREKEKARHMKHTPDGNGGEEPYRGFDASVTGTPSAPAPAGTSRTRQRLRWQLHRSRTNPLSCDPLSWSYSHIGDVRHVMRDVKLAAAFNAWRHPGTESRRLADLERVR